MKEIEVKAKMRDREGVIAAVQAMGGTFSDPISQNDRIFLPNGIQFSDIGNNTNVLRIREQGGRVIFTLKRRDTNDLVKIEKEVELKDAGKMADILGDLGFHAVLAIHKVRRKALLGDVEICIDEVEGLGDFIEAEKMSESGDALKIQSDLFQLLMSLGISESDRVFEGYDTMIYKKRGTNL